MGSTNKMATSRMTRIRLLLWSLVTVAALGAGWLLLSPQANETAADTLGRGDYTLETTTGEAFTQASLEGAPSAVFFGFTHCPDVCPTTLGDIATWQEALEPDGERLRVYFVTVDPERDTAAVLGDYVAWVPGVTGVTGSREEMDKAIAAFRVYAAKVPLGGEEYSMDHSSMVLLFDEDGRFFAPIGYQEDPERAIGSITRLLEG